MPMGIVQKWRCAVLLMAGITVTGVSAAPQTPAGYLGEQLLVKSSKTVGPELPEQPFGAWLDSFLPKGTERSFEFVPCDEVPPSARPTQCLRLDLRIVSRHRQVWLYFREGPLTFYKGMMWSEELEGRFDIPILQDLPKLAKRPMRPFPLTCPKGTNLKLREEHAGLFEWCEDGEGTKEGPARAWFSTGIYLMYRGQFAGGHRNGAWIECNRFERCNWVLY